MDPNQYPSKPETRRLLTAARYFLGERNFLDAADYASRALQSDPNHPEPNRILTIASVLSSRDHYAAVGVTRFESDQNVIWSSCQTLTGVLNPTVNTCPYASEAYAMVLKAREVLSDPVEKAKFDNSLRGGTLGSSSDSTFWTMCPYCYYVYEYDRAYEECCLRCDNDGCKRAFHGVKIVSNPPPSSVIEKGFYVCYGFFPLSYCNGRNGDESDENKGERERSWDPFGTVSGCSSEGVITDVPDEDTGAGSNGFEDHQCNGQMTRVEAEGGNNDRVGVFSNQTDLTKKRKEMKVTRKKMVSWDSKKANGIGFRVNHNEDGNNFTDGLGEREELLVEDEEFGQTFHNNDVESGVEFFYGDDDILIGLQSDSELEKMGL